MLLRVLERVFFIVLIFFLMGAATVIFYSDVDQDAYLALQGSLHLPIVIIQLSLAAVGGVLVMTRWRRVAAAAIQAWPILALAGLQLASAVWSIDPILTLRKTILECIMLAMSIYLGERYPPDELARKILSVLCQAMVLILILLVVSPHTVLQSDAHNALKGLSQNKNGFGYYIGLTVAMLMIVRFRKRHDWIRYFFLPVACLMLVFSRSMTSVASAGVIIMSLPLWLVFRLPAKQRVAGYIFISGSLVLAGVCSMLFSDELLGLLGKDSTFTGRTGVWKQLVIAIHHHPILGYGYGAFWTGLRGESLDVLITSGWIVPSAHNAYLELWLAIGIPGLIVTAFVILSAFHKSIRYIQTERTWTALWPVMFLSFLLVHGLGESEFIYDASLACCLFTAMYTSLSYSGHRVTSHAVEQHNLEQPRFSAGLDTLEAVSQ